MTEGLDQVIAAETALSHVDGTAGELVIRGQRLDALVAGWRYEGVLSLLFEGLLENAPDSASMQQALGQARANAFERLMPLDSQLLSLPPLDAVRAAMARLPDGQDIDAALQLVAAPAVVLPAVLRCARGEAPLPPDAQRTHAEDILLMLDPRTAGPGPAAALDTYLVTVSDHGLNASTFAARVVASTGAGFTSAALAALSALKGPLHGGAPGPVLDMLDAIGSAERAEPWIGAALARGERLMGFGHRIYRVRDPRADALKGALQRLRAEGRGDETRLALAQAVESKALQLLRRHRPGRVLETNVEFYTAVLLEALGFPREAFTGVFGIGRIGGWLAHAREQWLRGRLIRPQSRYVGPAAA